MLRLGAYRQTEATLADFLPWAALIAPGVVLNKDGAFQRSARYRGKDTESATAQELIAATARTNDVLRRFGSNWAFFFDADRRPASHYPRSAFPDPVSELVDQERAFAFGQRGAAFETVYHLTVVYLPPTDLEEHASSVLIERGESEASATDYRRHLEAFIQRTDRLFDLLAQVFDELTPLGDEETLTFLHDCISERRHVVRAPETPMYLDAALADTPLSGGLEPMLGGSHLRVLSVLGYPGSTTPALLHGLNALGFAWRWSTRWTPLDKPDAETLLKRYRRGWFAKRRSVGGLLREAVTQEASPFENPEAIANAGDVDAALAELGEDYVSFGYLTSKLVFKEQDPAAAREHVRLAQREIDGLGFATINETLNAVEAWFGSLPGHVYADVRHAPMHSLNLSHLAPLSAVWTGAERNAHLSGPPLAIVHTSGSTPFRLNLHIGDVGHSLIVGPTGSGKSALIGFLAMQWRRYSGARVAIFDKGASARAWVLGMGGGWFDLGGLRGLRLQPLARIDDAQELTAAREWMLGLLAREGVAIDHETRTEVWAALRSLASAPIAQRTISGLASLLARETLRAALEPFTSKGAFGRLFDGDADLLSIGDVVGFETEGLADTPAASEAALRHLFHRLETQFRDGRPTLLILDEAWLYLDNPQFAARIREWLKTLRKRNVAVIFATQSLADIAQSAIAPTIIESCPTRMFLPNPRAEEPEIRRAYQGFGLNERQIEIIGRSTPKRHYYVQSPVGARLIDLGLGEIALAFAAASSSEDQAMIDQLLRTHGATAFPEMWLRHRGRHEAARLLAAHGSPSPTQTSEIQDAEDHCGGAVAWIAE